MTGNSVRWCSLWKVCDQVSSVEGRKWQELDSASAQEVVSRGSWSRLAEASIGISYFPDQRLGVVRMMWGPYHGAAFANGPRHPSGLYVSSRLQNSLPPAGRGNLW